MLTIQNASRLFFMLIPLYVGNKAKVRETKRKKNTTTLATRNTLKMYIYLFFLNLPKDREKRSRKFFPVSRFNEALAVVRYCDVFTDFFFLFFWCVLTNKKNEHLFLPNQHIFSYSYLRGFFFSFF